MACNLYHELYGSLDAMGQVVLKEPTASIRDYCFGITNKRFKGRGNIQRMSKGLFAHEMLAKNKE